MDVETLYRDILNIVSPALFSPRIRLSIPQQFRNRPHFTLVPLSAIRIGVQMIRLHYHELGPILLEYGNHCADAHGRIGVVKPSRSNSYTIS